MGWISVGIRLSFIATFSLFWLNQDYVSASSQSDPIEQPRIPSKPKDLNGALALDILEKLYQDRHEPFLKELGKFLGDQGLSDIEKKLGADFVKAFNSKDNMRRYMIEYIMNEMSFQTIAVGVNKNTKTVVIAGNIKAFDFWNLAGEVRKKQLRITRVGISDVGFRPSDYKIIEDIVSREYPDHKVVVIQPSDKDLDNCVKDIQDAKGVDRKTLELREKAQAFHAEMQVRNYMENNGGLAEHDVTIVASKQYCVNCWNNLVEKGLNVVEMDGKMYSAPNMRWKEPTELTILHSAQLPNHVDLDPHATETSNVVEILEASGGTCSSRPACRSLQDFDQVRAEEFHNQIQRLPQGDRESLLYALERIGRDKLTGSMSTMDGIHKIWMGWKKRILIGVIEALRTRTIVHGFLRGATKTFEPERIAVSPSILVESLNHLQETEMVTLSQEHERYQNGEMEEGRKSLKATELGYTFVKKLNLAMVGKNLIGAALDGDPLALCEVARLFAADRLLGKAGNNLVLQGTRLAEAGERALGTTLKIGGPVVGSLTLGFTIYGLFSDINELKYLDELCKGNHTLIKDGLKNDCHFDHDIAIANIVASGVGSVAGVALIVEGVLTALSVSTGPAGLIFAAIDLLVAIGSQIFQAVETVAKISSMLVGGLTGWQTFQIGLKSFFHKGLPPDITHLLDIKKGYNMDVNFTAQVLKKMDKFQTYVAPTTHTRSQIKLNCNCNSFPGAVWKELAYLKCLLNTQKFGNCQLKREFEDYSFVNFQEKQRVHRFKVEPDKPDWGTLECKPNSPAHGRYANDPEYAGTADEFLCQNVIAHSAPNRPDFPVLVDLRDGNDYMKGFPNRKHVFLAANGIKQFYGGSADDVFVIKSENMFGEFDGGGGTNTLLLDNDKDPLQIESYVLGGGNACEIPAEKCIRLANIQQVIGRGNKSDTVVTASSTTYIDLNGGESGSKPDKIIVPHGAGHAHSTTLFHLCKFTTLELKHGGQGNFIYQVDFAPGILVDFQVWPNSTNRFILPNDIVHADLTIGPGSLIITDKEAGKEIKLKLIDLTLPGLTMMTQGGLVLSYDKAAKLLTGVAHLSSGKDEKQEDLTGFVNHPNHFVLNTSNPVHVQGGDKDDLFILAGTNSLRGGIWGGDGVNSVLIQQDFNPKRSIAFNFEADRLFECAESLESDSFGPCEAYVRYTESLSITDIVNVIGRLGLPEEIRTNCGVKWLDLRGGLQGAPDIIRIPNGSSDTEMTLMISNFTTVENQATEGIFRYRIDIEGSQTSSIKVNMDGSATHNYIFKQTYSSNVTHIKFNRKSNEFTIQFKQGSWSGILPPERSTLHLADQLAIELVPEIRGVVHVQSSDGMDKIGLPAHPNIFVLEKSTLDSKFIAGGKDDTFFVASDSFRGQIHGGEGNNTFAPADGLWSSSPLIIDGMDKSVRVKRIEGTAIKLLEFSDIQRLLGRVGQADVIYPGCDTTLIDTRGGGNAATTYDLVHVSSSLNCYLDLDLAIRPNLILINDARDGEFRYEGDFRGGNTSIFLTFSQNAHHDVYLAMDFLELEKLDLSPKEGRVNMTAGDQSQFSIDFFIPLGEQIHTQPSIVFQDGLQLKISHHGGYSSTAFGILRDVSGRDIAELDEDLQKSGLLQRYLKTAKDTRTNVVMEVRPGTLVSIGSGGRFDVLTAVPGYKENILVCNGASETVYRIANGTSKVEIVSSEFGGAKVLDLRPIAKAYPGLVPSEIRRVGENDFVIFIRDVEITVKGSPRGPFNMHTWTVLLRETYLNLEWRVNRIELVPQPIVVDPTQQDTVVLNTINLERQAEILQSLNTGIMYEPMRQENNLVFTNLFQNDTTTSKPVATVIFLGYYNEGVREGVLGKNVAFEKEPGDFFVLGKSDDEGLPTLEQRLSEDPGFQEVPTDTHVKDEL